VPENPEARCLDPGRRCSVDYLSSPVELTGSSRVPLPGQKSYPGGSVTNAESNGLLVRRKGWCQIDTESSATFVFRKDLSAEEVVGD